MEMLEQYGHGGDLLTAQKLFGGAEKKFLDFSANINPLGPPPSVMDALKNSLDTIVHYPDPAQRELKAKLAERLAVQTDQLLIGNGAAECMALAILGLKPNVIGVIYPCFSEYEQLANSFEADIKGCVGTAENDYKPSRAELFQLMEQVDLIFIGHPNNPTGAVYTKEELVEIGEQSSKTDTYVIVDEAFIDFLPDGQQVTMLSELKQYKKMIIIRSMTKFYAIPGLRLGYMVADPEIISICAKKQVTWNVNQLALLAGNLSLDEKEYEKQTVTLIQEQRAYLKSVIENEFGWFVFSGRANFLLIRLPKTMEVSKLQWHMGKKGILIRSCSMYKGLTPNDFRIAVRTKQENDIFLNVLREVCKEVNVAECR